MRTKKRLVGLACGALFLLAVFVFMAADDAQAQGMGGGFSRSGSASSGSFASMQREQNRQMQQNRQLQRDIKEQVWDQEQQNRQMQYDIKQQERQIAQQPRQEYVSDYDDYQAQPSRQASYAPPVDGAAFATGPAIGSVITAGELKALGASCISVIVGDTEYYQCGSTWYQPVNQDGYVTYVVVNPPQE